jgi:hypothetical protein
MFTVMLQFKVRRVRARLRAAASSTVGLVAFVAELPRIRRETQQNREAIVELRRLGGRVSELADLVTELLVVAATREDPEFKRVVKKYLESA